MFEALGIIVMLLLGAGMSASGFILFLFASGMNSQDGSKKIGLSILAVGIYVLYYTFSQFTISIN